MHPRRLYAHRGASAERPENTLIAFERAVELEVDALELDVHLTRDGQLIVAHDDTAQRMTGVPVPWAELDLADVRRLDVGWGFVAADGTRPFAGRGIGVPLFEDILRTFPTMPLNVDIKGPGARHRDNARGNVMHRALGRGQVMHRALGRGQVIDVTLELIRRAGAEERVTLASFQLKTLVEVRRRGYGGPTCLAQSEVGSLAALPAVLWRQLPFTGTAAQVPVKAGPLRFDRPAFIAKCHSLGLRVDFWTIDDPVEAARLLALGADGIMTNDPAALRPVFRALP